MRHWAHTQFLPAGTSSAPMSVQAWPGFVGNAALGLASVPPSPPQTPPQAASAPPPPAAEGQLDIAEGQLDIAPSILLLAVVVSGFTYGSVDSYAAPAICASLSLAILVAQAVNPVSLLQRYPVRAFVRCLPYLWLGLVLCGPLIFLGNDLRSTPAHISQRMARVPPKAPLLICVFLALGAFTATLSVPKQHKALSLCGMACLSCLRHTYVAALTGGWAINVGIAAASGIPAALGFVIGDHLVAHDGGVAAVTKLQGVMGAVGLPGCMRSRCKGSRGAPRAVVDTAAMAALRRRAEGTCGIW